MTKNLLVGVHDVKADLAGRVVMPSRLRDERRFFVYLCSLPKPEIHLVPESKFKEYRRRKYLILELDAQNRVNLSAYEDRYGIAGKNIIFWGDFDHIKVITLEEYEKAERRLSKRKNKFLDEYGI